MNDKELKILENEALKEIDLANNLAELNEIKNKYLSKKSVLATIMGTFKDLTPEKRAEVGKEVNIIKQSISDKLEEKTNVLQAVELQNKLISEQIDISLTGSTVHEGGKNPYFTIVDEAINIFTSMGFNVVEGPDVEEDKYNFELMNMPKDHPARDMQDTFYIDVQRLMRTHTSPVQARVMQENTNKDIKVICPGKTYRRDDDATHSHQFGQIEGLVIGQNISLANLKGLLDLFVKKMFGPTREIRLRSSYFPFTEPSVEVDVTCAECGGKGCSFCKGTGWIEILGAGMVHPNVLKMSGFDPEKFTGLAFGIGIERVAILRYGIDNIRKFYFNDVKFLSQFKRKN